MRIQLAPHYKQFWLNTLDNSFLIAKIFMSDYFFQYIWHKTKYGISIKLASLTFLWPFGFWWALQRKFYVRHAEIKEHDV